MPLALCRRCHQEFDPATNHPTACRFHPDPYSGQTLRREYDFNDEMRVADIGGRLGDGEGVLVRQYFCCGARGIDAPGCTALPHATYDDPPDDVVWRSRL
eukprot:TRINITY_DN3454_c0_g1_i1.p2 TRINITY_DN3454_c0_g1~~TRINITY_DN3454_c0_g1_i1.p2  ORF type:complete len:100 (+),score=17.25 TRINITY_DN3454_c0_g1_i1:146-445(+)